jgi:Fe-S-cluster containining protein
MHMPISPLDKHQTFSFSCSPEVRCFNACCRDLNQALTPFDVLCLTQFLNMPSGEFLEMYAEASIGPQTGLPVVSLRFRAADDLACPFVTDAGCRVYPARPASCRTYPLARGVSRNQQTGRLTEHWALIREPHCRGFECGRRQTVSQWVADQQLATHNRINDMMLDPIGLKKRHRPGPLTPTEQKRIYTALYDLDAFRKEFFSSGDAVALNSDPETLERARTENLDLLILAMQWVRITVLGDTGEGSRK